MTKENKKLLIEDLCARLPYGVKYVYDGFNRPVRLDAMYPIGDRQVRGTWGNTFHDIKKVEEIKPYLFPMSSMTKEQREEYNTICSNEWYDIQRGEIDAMYDGNDWLNEHHFDYRGLIKKGLAIDCTNLNIY